MLEQSEAPAQQVQHPAPQRDRTGRPPRWQPAGYRQVLGVFYFASDRGTSPAKDAADPFPPSGTARAPSSTTRRPGAAGPSAELSEEPQAGLWGGFMPAAGEAPQHGQ